MASGHTQSCVSTRDDDVRETNNGRMYSNAAIIAARAMVPAYAARANCYGVETEVKLGYKQDDQNKLYLITACLNSSPSVSAGSTASLASFAQRCRFGSSTLSRVARLTGPSKLLPSSFAAVAVACTRVSGVGGAETCVDGVGWNQRHDR